MQERGRVGDVRLEPAGQVHVLLDDRVPVQRQPSVELREDRVLLAQDDLELLSEDLLVEQVLDAQADASGLVGVGGADPALRRAERVPAEEPLRHLLQLEVVRHDQVTVPGHLEPRHVHAGASQVLQLAEEVARVDDHAVGDHGGDVGVEDAGRDQLELEQTPFRDHRVPCVVAALIADDEVHPVREVVDGLALALVPPLGPEHDGGRHVGSVYRG